MRRGGRLPEGSESGETSAGCVEKVQKPGKCSRAFQTGMVPSLCRRSFVICYVVSRKLHFLARETCTTLFVGVSGSFRQDLLNLAHFSGFARRAGLEIYEN